MLVVGSPSVHADWDLTPSLTGREGRRSASLETRVLGGTTQCRGPRE